MSWDNNDPNVTGLYMEDISRYSMLPVDVEIKVGRRARLGYGITVGIGMIRSKLGEVREGLASGGITGRVARLEIRSLERRLMKVRKQRCDFDMKVTTDWPEKDRWMAPQCLEALDRMIEIVTKVRELASKEETETEALVAALDDVLVKTDQAEQTYSALIDAGHEAVDTLVQANLRFVIAVAKKYQNKGLDLSELISAGNEGLIKAARKFDERMGVRYVSYSAYWISQQIQKELDYAVGTVRPTQTQMVRNRRVWRLISEARRDGREPSMEELMKETGYTEARILEAMDTNIAIMSLDAPVDRGDSGSTTFAQFVGADDSSEERETEMERHETVIKAINEVLTPREAKIILLYYGIGGQEEWPLADIGDSLGISRERARQLKDRALEKLANCWFASALLEVHQMDRRSGKPKESGQDAEGRGTAEPRRR